MEIRERRMKGEWDGGTNGVMNGGRGGGMGGGMEIREKNEGRVGWRDKRSDEWREGRRDGRRKRRSGGGGRKGKRVKILHSIKYNNI